MKLDTLIRYFVILPALSMITNIGVRADTAEPENGSNQVSELKEERESEKPQRLSAIFAGGCFWCLEHDLERLDGVVDVISGYTGGTTKNPTYRDVLEGDTGHVEAVKVLYDPQKISYHELLDAFWSNVDPFDEEGQFCDRGNQYRSMIFPLNSEQRKLAEESKETLKKKLLSLPQNKGKEFVTPIFNAKKFYPAESEHQDYAARNKTRYKYYRWRCGRDSRLKEIQSESSRP